MSSSIIGQAVNLRSSAQMQRRRKWSQEVAHLSLLHWTNQLRTTVQSPYLHRHRQPWLAPPANKKGATRTSRPDSPTTRSILSLFQKVNNHNRLSGARNASPEKITKPRSPTVVLSLPPLLTLIWRENPLQSPSTPSLPPQLLSGKLGQLPPKT